MTSGNLSEEPIVVDNQDARERLGGVADWFLVHNRDIYMRADDSVVRMFEGEERVMRRSRGYAPQTLDVGRDLPELLACGGELKNVFCLTKGTHAILSQHIGDLENYETLVFFEETLANLKKLFRVTPRAVAYDLHPGYLSTKYALELEGLEKIGVQHHHAHIASCMAENGLTGEVIGVAMDGTGYGLDGAIWGGEFLVASYAGFTRRAHLRYVPLAGGDAAVREPWRSALGYAGAAERLAGVDEKRLRVVQRMIATGTNTVMTSSCGRLFDAVAALTGLRYEVNFEGQAAIELEAIADGSCEERYEFEISRGGCRFPADDGAHREGDGGAGGSGGAVSQYAGGGDPRDVPADAAGERPESRVPERRDVSEYAAAGADGAGTARVGVRALPASQCAAQRWRDRAGAGGDRSGTNEVNWAADERR